MAGPGRYSWLEAGALVRKEGEMTKPEAGLHLQAQLKKEKPTTVKKVA